MRNTFHQIPSPVKDGSLGDSYVFGQPMMNAPKAGESIAPQQIVGWSSSPYVQQSLGPQVVGVGNLQMNDPLASRRFSQTTPHVSNSGAQSGYGVYPVTVNSTQNSVVNPGAVQTGYFQYQQPKDALRQSQINQPTSMMGQFNQSVAMLPGGWNQNIQGMMQQMPRDPREARLKGEAPQYPGSNRFISVNPAEPIQNTATSLIASPIQQNRNRSFDPSMMASSPYAPQNPYPNLFPTKFPESPSTSPQKKTVGDKSLMIVPLAVDGSPNGINLPAHHGKSLRSIQLFENSTNPHYPHVMHSSINPTIPAYEPKKLKQPVKMNIHADSCYNFLYKRRYDTSHEDELTPLEKFFMKESVGQYKVAKILNRTSSRTLMKPKPILQRRKKYLLVLDIDETLVHSELIVEQSINKPAIHKKYDTQVEFRNPNGTVDIYGVRYRPFLHEFIERMSKLYDLAVYTASAQDYADAVMDQLDPQRQLFCGRLYRDNCLPISGMNIKNMLNFEGNDVFIVDNLIYSYALQLDQGIPICPFIDDEMDVELKDLAEILENLPAFDSMQALVQELMGLDQFYDRLERGSEGLQVNQAMINQHVAQGLGDRTAASNAMTF